MSAAGEGPSCTAPGEACPAALTEAPACTAPGEACPATLTEALAAAAGTPAECAAKIARVKALYEAAGVPADALKAVKALSGPEVDFAALAPLIEAAAGVKRRIVEQDPYEENLRRCLNLGHTYAHAIEWYQHTHGAADPLTHGEAVAVGIVQAALLSERLGLCKAGLAEQLRGDLAACGLPTELPCPQEELETALWKDKKAEKGIIHFVLIKKIGKVIIKDLDDLHQPAE